MPTNVAKQLLDGPDNPLLGARNCLITPHIAWATQEARQRLLTTTITNVLGQRQRHPQADPLNR